MKPEEISQARLLDQIRELKNTCESAIRVVRHKQSIKHNRISALLKKRYELTHAYSLTLRYLDSEITVTRNSQDYSRSLRPRSSSKQGRNPDFLQ